MHEATAIVHSPIPPCSCSECLRATAKADQRRAKLDMELRYSFKNELKALVMAEEYCHLHGITDPLQFRFVHYAALSLLVEDGGHVGRHR